eukprot:264089_1
MEVSTNIMVSVFYLTSVFFLLRWMKRRAKPFQLKWVMIVYNTFQIIINAYVIYGLCHPSIQLTNPLLVNVSSTAKESKHTFHFVYIHMLCKILDFMDTIFIVLKKKSRQLSFLHLYHHSTIGVIWCYLLANDVVFGTVSFGALLNSIIHCIMYSYYLLSALKIKTPFKKLVTLCQMMQFMMMIGHCVVVVFYERESKAPWELQLFYQFTMLLLFGNFSRKTYAKKITKQQ